MTSQTAKELVVLKQGLMDSKNGGTATMLSNRRDDDETAISPEWSSSRLTCGH